MDRDFKYSYYPEGSRSPEGVPTLHHDILALRAAYEPIRIYGQAKDKVWHQTTATDSGLMDTVCGLKDEPTTVVTTHRSWMFNEAEASRSLCSGCDRRR